MPRRTCLPGAGDCSQTPMPARHERVEEAAAALALELEVELPGRLLGVVDRQAGEVRHRDALLARDTEGGHRGGAAAGGGDDVDHVGALGELDAGGELAAADLRDVALDPDARAGRADGAADLHRRALDDGGVERRGDVSCTGFWGLGGGVVVAAAAQEGARETDRDEGSEPHRRQPGYRPP